MNLKGKSLVAGVERERGGGEMSVEQKVVQIMIGEARGTIMAGRRYVLRKHYKEIYPETKKERSCGDGEDR